MTIPSGSLRPRSQRIQALVLRHSDWGEADRLLWLFTLEAGKLRVVAKGVRKPRSRKAGHLEPFTHVRLLVAQGKDLSIVTQAEAVDTFIPLREDLVRIGYASYVVELLDRFTYEEGENVPLFYLLVQTLERLSSEEDPAFAVHYYEVRLLDLVGFRPHLVHCARCQSPIQPQDQFFSPDQGGVICPSCAEILAPAGISMRAISMPTLRLLRHFQRSNYAESRRLHLEPTVDRELEQLMQYYFTYLLERGLNTPAFLRRIRRDQMLSNLREIEQLED